MAFEISSPTDSNICKNFQYLSPYKMLGLGEILSYISEFFDLSNSNEKDVYKNDIRLFLETFIGRAQRNFFMRKCLQTRLGHEYESSLEKLSTLKSESEYKNTLLLKGFSSFLTKAAKHLESDMFLNRKDLKALLSSYIEKWKMEDEIKANPIKVFIWLNKGYHSTEKFTIDYFDFVLDYLVYKYKEDFDKLESLDLRNLLRFNFIASACDKRSRGLEGGFENLFHLDFLVDFLNKSILDALNSYPDRNLHTEY